ncbi:MAG: hypothetical protein JSS30_04300 [Verrucomicrobia bacterium]|nr:hypothetical protein [Verrucomicrobiota bacterium]
MATAISGPALNQIFTIDPIVQEQNDQFWETVWKVAQYAAIGLFIISATTGFVLTSLFYPSQVFGVTLAIYTLGLYYMGQFSNYLSSKVQGYANSAIAQRKLVKQLDLLKDANLPDLVRSLGIHPPADLSENELKVGLAQYLSLKEEQSNLQVKRKELKAKYPYANDPRALENLNWQDEKALDGFDTTQEVRIHRRNLKNRAALTNLMAAHTLKVLHCPFENRGVEDYCQLNHLHATPVLISKAHGDLSTDVLVKTAVKNFTVQELLKKDATTLACEIFGLPRNLS